MKFVTTPTLLLIKQTALNNIRFMANKATKAGVEFRPHFKTHQSAEVAEWFRSEGVEKITVSSLEMAEYFAAEGWNDILVAFPVNIRESETINRLAAKIHLTLLVESAATARMLNDLLTNGVRVSIKLDAGYGRTGIGIDCMEEISALVSQIHQCERLTLNGFALHNGHTYRTKSTDEIGEINRLTLEKIIPLKKLFPGAVFSMGDTPSCSLLDEFKGFTEIRPGNFVFYDLMQWKLGVCSLSQIAVALACPVVAIHPERNQILVYGGAVQLSKECLDVSGNGEFIYGMVFDHFPLADNSQPIGMVSSVSQEHGVITLARNQQIPESGSLVYIVPVHSCLTAQAMAEYRLMDGTPVDHLFGNRKQKSRLSN